jgi:hypothetical protein
MTKSMNPALFPTLHTPALPAAALLFGMVFCLALAHFAGVSWLPVATITFYVALFAWVSGMLWLRRASLGRLGIMDMLFAAFVVIVLGSLAATPGKTGAAQKYLRYLPFMMVAPYLCGRLMRGADMTIFMRVTLIAGVAMPPLLLLDRFTSVGRELGRWPFFGHDHGALLVGTLLAVALIALCVHALDSWNPGAGRRWITYGLIGLMTACLVWVMARGWLIAGLAGVTVVSLSMRHRAPVIRASLFAFVVGVVALSLTTLPATGFYSGLLTAPALTAPALTAPAPTAPAPTAPAPTAPAPVTAVAGPILGEASCQPFRDGVNSVAIRSVLYQEAVAMFTKNPVFGVGATRFGDYSCTGPGGGYPHSTILQGFAELGLVGGGLLAGLLALAALTLMRTLPTAEAATNGSAAVFALALFAALLAADQIYGNYFMSAGMWLMLGFAASLRTHEKQEPSRG